MNVQARKHVDSSSRGASRVRARGASLLTRRESVWGSIVGATGITLGITAERAAYDVIDARHWVPDLAVGLCFIGAGIYAMSRERGTSALLAATGFMWFFGNFWPAALYVHRGPLMHLIVTYRGWRPRSRLELTTVIAGYVAALAQPIWHDEAVSIVLALSLMVVAMRDYQVATGRARSDRLVGLRVSVAVGLALAGGAAVRLAAPPGTAVEPTLFLYQAVLCGLAVALAVGIHPTPASSVADLVVELGEAPSGTLRDALARTLGDPTLQIGYWALARGFVDAEGRSVSVPPSGDARSATFVERESQPFAVLVHDASVLKEPALVEAVASATRLSAANAGLQAEVRTQVAGVAASRRRLLTTAGEERERLESRLRDGAERRLRALERDLRLACAGADGAAREHVELAERHLAHALDDLGEIARGLHPRELSAGLGPALAALAARSPVPVELTVTDERLGGEIEAAIYYVCAEALANVVQHASAARVALHVSRRSQHVVVVIADDGVGGADMSHGVGLQGLADRVETLGGVLGVDSPHGGGTRVTAELPLGRQPR